KNCGLPASTSHAARSRNIARRCEFPPRCSAAATSRSRPAPHRERPAGDGNSAHEKDTHGGDSGHAAVSPEGFGFRTEGAVHLDPGITLQAEAMAADAYASAEQAASRIERRLRRYKRRLRDRQASRAEDAVEVPAQSYVIAAPEGDEHGEVTEFNPVIIAESTTALKR